MRCQALESKNLQLSLAKKINSSIELSRDHVPALKGVLTHDSPTCANFSA